MGKIAFVFAGQGAQHPGMGTEVYKASKKAAALMDLFEKMRPGTLKACFEPEAGEQSVTSATQPLLYAVDLACAAFAEEAGLIPEAVCGFSLGEIPAAAYGGIVGYEEGFELVQERGNRMQACAEQHDGVMYAVLRLTPEAVEKLCAGLTDVYPVNYNTHDQTVVAMGSDSEAGFLSALKGIGGRGVKLKVGGAFHTPFMNAASEALKEYMDAMTLKKPHLPVYSNVTGQPYEGDIRSLLAKQVISPVRWRLCVENMIQSGIDTFVEVGAGSVLTGLIRKIDPDVTAVNVEDVASLNAAIKAVGL